jgi:hypothetical protein
MKKLIVILALIPLIYIGCTKEISVNFPNPPDLIVVEGHIEPGGYAYVILTKNAPYFAPTDTATLLKYLITNATVVVSDGVINDTLSFTYNSTFMPYFPVFYQGSKIIGQPNHTYTLTVIADGQTVTSTTTIPGLVPLDSTWFQVEGSLDSLGFIYGILHDPDTMGNCYRFMTKRISHFPDGTQEDLGFIADRNSVFNDKIFNGQTFDVDFDRPHLPHDTSADDHNVEDGYFKKGDTIILKFMTIDQAQYNFWLTEGIAAQGADNPFAAPTIVKSNIIGGLGIWGGYGTTYDTIIAK